MADFKPKLGIVEATKIGAARHQLEAAIDAFEDGEYAVAITLAGATEGMLPEDASQPLFTRLRDHPDAPVKGKDWINVLNAEIYWLKHLSEGRIGPEIAIDANDVTIVLLRALAKIPDPWSERMKAFRDWAMVNGFGPKDPDSPYIDDKEFSR